MKLRICQADGRVGLILMGAVVCLGCSAEPNTTDRFVPNADLARQAVEQVLVDWQAGRAPSPIDRLDVGIQVVDKQRKKGQSLEEYEILGEAPSEAARCFAVRVRLSGPDAEEKVRFVVIGIDPLWVFRQEDYESVGQWVCGKPEDDEAKPPDSENASGLSAPPATDADSQSEPQEPDPRQDE